MPDEDATMLMQVAEAVRDHAAGVVDEAFWKKAILTIDLNAIIADVKSGQYAARKEQKWEEIASHFEFILGKVNDTGNA